MRAAIPMGACDRGSMRRMLRRAATESTTERLPWPAVIAFGILGPLEARRDGEEVALGGRNQRAVLALLLLEAGRVVSIDRIAEELYAGDTPVTRGDAGPPPGLRAAPGARRGGSVIETRPPGYLVHVEPEALDLRRFERSPSGGRALEAGDPRRGASPRCDEALALWRGDALADLAVRAVRPARRSRASRSCGCARSSAAHRGASSRWGVTPTASAELRELADAHPLRERLRELLMLALYRAGRQVEALEVYRETRDAARRDLRRGARARAAATRAGDPAPRPGAVARARPQAPLRARRGAPRRPRPRPVRAARWSWPRRSRDGPAAS